ncbi:MAG: hypothetical protein H6767_04490 [Candidatus Peribacteria bacterium]|nr:MAG: hypothetical protein H6767_04490 [Candidatus Peribacteria bacterium]
MLDGESASYDLGTEVQPISSADRSYFKENISRGDILRYLRKEFTGEIEQMPPKYSALKVDGKRALDRVRQGEEFDLKARTIQIDAIELLDYEYPRADLRAVVGPGTYIRSIAHDLGALIGSGGYVTFLRRTALANVSVDMAQQLDDFVAEKTLEISKLFSPEKYVSLSPEDQWRADNGLPIATIEEYIEGEYYFVIQELGITNVLQYVEGSLKPVRKLNIG